ncbi:MAG: 16S rRNA (cytosine(1402)-N(4))-methyltransferase RsmH [Verrucomicrobia bacterium]|nr:16S rRNA (cytosine(1402)-N(4))-methyltransferase RsmH [Verrucomicrobiota bacterium]
MSSEPSDAEHPAAPAHKRRPRYAGKNPRKFADKYKELNPELYPEMIGKITAAGKTPAGTHVPVLVGESMHALNLQPGQCGVDCTLGFGGHAREILQRILPGGKLIGLDIDPVEQPKTLARLRQAGFGSDVFEAIPSNYAGVAKVLKQQGIEAVDFLFADLGCSSMQIDDPARGFTFKADGPLDMRMNPNRGISAAVLLEKMSVERLAVVLRENADEPHADRLASHLAGKFFSSTNELVRAIDDAAHDESGDTTRRVFQALRIEVNEEFSALDAFLRGAPGCLKPGGRIVVLSFHSGEDRRVKKAFQQLQRDGIFSEISEAVITAGPEERRANPRAIPAKLRFAIKSQ